MVGRRRHGYEKQGGIMLPTETRRDFGRGDEQGF